MKKEFSKDYQINKNIENTVYKDCPYFPCHDLDEDDFCCLFCYCVYYDASKPEGGCRSNKGTGTWHYYEENGIKKKIWDCSKCIYPHKKENAKKIFLSFYKDKPN